MSRVACTPPRFIPARAGNTPFWRSPKPRMPVHPRSRGEHWPSTALMQPSYGSSPLARGTPVHKHPPDEFKRFIPARAGNTGDEDGPKRRMPVHPRSRGEHRGPGSVAGERAGSSPLARGTRAEIRELLAERRFIPARAGNTLRFDLRCADPAVHPRSRGEHDQWVCLPGTHGGSSPLARGTPVNPLLLLRRDRFIPARAGNTGYGAWRPAPSSVHPRSRGEHAPPPAAPSSSSGSSPLARGTPAAALEDGLVHRFIPARAGNTGRR